MTRPDQDTLVGRLGKGQSGRGGSGAAQKLIDKLSKRLKAKAPRSQKFSSSGFSGSAAFDARQRAVAKIHYFSHAGGGAAALKAHGKYVARDAAARDGPSSTLEADESASDTEKKPSVVRTHADYLERGGERGAFYDANQDAVDGGARLEAWAQSDRRHFRIILSAEEAQRLQDLPGYTREVMARAGAALDTKLSWVAVDHHDTDNAHTHIIVRGRRANGQDLVLPRDFIKHGFRGIARDVATEWLGNRTPEHERMALDRDARRHGPTRLDRMIEAQAPDQKVRVAEICAPNDDPHLTRALKARVQELERMGLAKPVGRGVFQFTPDWRDRLNAMELHLDIRKRVMRERVERGLAQHQAVREIRKGLLDR
ncbi:relaxase/mobilization nuclease domain-containing protein [Vitreimonas flagellata]|uniref:relaxase/mobilization nuclease domain-containing protein n=1 Tax=Vitreimonas flagellata TaxID=2560861 RepID=UPI001074C608|nr:relaxase/mobilization nuclease domain-containing protein [Vitreimonas flagellata]